MAKSGHILTARKSALSSTLACKVIGDGRAVSEFKFSGKHEFWRLLVFGSFGPNRGKPKLFPAPTLMPHKMQSTYVHSSGMLKNCDYGNYVAHQMCSQQPVHRVQHVQYQYSPAVYPQRIVNTPQHAMSPLPTARLGSHWHAGIAAAVRPFVPLKQLSNDGANFVQGGRTIVKCTGLYALRHQSRFYCVLLPAWRLDTPSWLRVILLSACVLLFTFLACQCRGPCTCTLTS